MPDDGRDKRGGSAALQAKQHAAHQKLVFQQQQALVQQQLQRIVGGDALAAHQLSLDVSAERMNDMLTNHFTRHSLDNKVWNKLLGFANGQLGYTFRANNDRLSLRDFCSASMETPNGSLET